MGISGILCIPGTSGIPGIAEGILPAIIGDPGTGTGVEVSKSRSANDNGF